MEKSIIGIDIGGTKIRSVLWDGKRAINAREFKTPKNLTAFKKLLGKLVRTNSARVTRIGIGVPGVVLGNKILFCPNIKYLKNFDIFQLRRPTSKLKLDNDARCFARAECGKKPCLAITLGTGIGRAFAKNGKVLKIKKFEYPESWEKEYQKLRDLKNNRALAIFLAKNLKGRFKEYNPAIIIAGGGVTERRDFLAKFQKAVKLPVRKSKFGKNSAAIGAAMLFQ
ncbi:MAG: ROK family protein [Candidatus Giovannonibacteria bacterium]|nr:ROK family protein [Candidatus Giovannonibacteria bacterium]